uniref:Calcyon neuron specific vesicular protein n=1 Tax=Sus scrofa TaxID=9823 RepID=A0A4X1V689_PIG
MDGFAGLRAAPPLPLRAGVGRGSPSTMVRLSCSFGKSSKDSGDLDGAAMDSVPLISPLDVSQLQPSFSDQVVIKTQTEYQLSSADQPKKFSDLEAQKLSGNPLEDGRSRMPTGRMIAFTMALLGCVLIMYKAIWYDQFSCPDGFLLRHKICTPLTLEMYYTELDPERHRSILAAIGAYPVGRKHGTETPWLANYHAFKEVPKARARPGAVAVTEPSRKPSGKPSGKASAPGEKEAAQKVAGSAPPPTPQ